ncbi:MAG: hypothetical protein J0H08_07095, partial [Rhizobiales bacterium]|nr:hypothetical protein [Hyphomicrobiales bacterium]
RAGPGGPKQYRTLGGRSVMPMHTAPWYDEPMPADAPPMLRVLRGDFFCAPFGPNDGIPPGPQHGPPANGAWHLEGSGEGWVDTVFEAPVLGARLTKRVEVRPGEAVVYQRHVFEGGEGRLPVGQHAMLRAEHSLHLGFSPRVFAATPPEPLETAPTGRSILAYPQDLADLHAAARIDGGTMDLTVYPGDDGHEDIWMLASEPDLAFGWTAATAPEEGWVWFGLKDPRTLPETLVWQSNGGRSYPPFSSRHRRVIGLEEVCSWFHLGHTASIADNALSRRGIPTAITLAPGGTVTIPYVFGVAPVPAGFGRVASIGEEDGGILITDENGREVFAAVDVSFVTNP